MRANPHCSDPGDLKCVPSLETPRPVSEAALDAAAAARVDVAAASAPPSSAAARDATYFWGGYSARRYGAPTTVPDGKDPLSRAQIDDWASHVSAIQVETAWDGVRDTSDHRKAFADKFVDAVRLFLWTHAAFIYKPPYDPYAKCDAAFEDSLFPDPDVPIGQAWDDLENRISKDAMENRDPAKFRFERPAAWPRPLQVPAEKLPNLKRYPDEDPESDSI